MKKTKFDPEKRLGDGIGGMSRQELCALVSELCARIRAESGSTGYRGGVFPDNISLDEDGFAAIGPASKSDWQGQELRFIAPEIFWGGKIGPAADVYSLGMLLYFGITGGRLPFDDQSPDQAQADRMNGKAIPVPPEAGRYLGEIIAKATAFKAEDRFQQVGELQAMVDSCLRDAYTEAGKTRSQTLFNKNSRELNDVERIMVSIIAQEPGAPAEPEEPEASAAEPRDEQFLELGEKPVKEGSAEPEVDEEMERIRALFNAPLEEPRFENEAVAQLPEQDEQEVLSPVPLAMSGESEDVRVYQPTPHSKTERSQQPVVRQPIPILTVEDNPELAPVVPLTSVDFGRGDSRQRAAQAEERRRRRPVGVVLVLCALLILAAIMGNAMLQNGGLPILRRTKNTTAAPGDDASGTVTIPTAPPEEIGGYSDTPFDYASLDQQVGEDGLPIEGGEETGDTGEGAEAQPQQRYEVVVSDLDWNAAQAAAREAGGYLAVVSTGEEFQELAGLVGASGITHAWVGCHRVDGELVWENDAEVDYYPWDTYEPSLYDGYDGVYENYLMMWFRDGRWAYNDSRVDPAADYPWIYQGQMGYVIEFDR